MVMAVDVKGERQVDTLMAEQQPVRDEQRAGVDLLEDAAVDRPTCVMVAADEDLVAAHAGCGLQTADIAEDDERVFLADFLVDHGQLLFVRGPAEAGDVFNIAEVRVRIDPDSPLLAPVLEAGIQALNHRNLLSMRGDYAKMAMA